MSFIYKYKTSTLTSFVKPRNVLNLVIQIVVYIQSYVESAFTYNLGLTIKYVYVSVDIEETVATRWRSWSRRGRWGCKWRSRLGCLLPRWCCSVRVLRRRLGTCCTCTWRTEKCVFTCCRNAKILSSAISLMRTQLIISATTWAQVPVFLAPKTLSLSPHTQ